LLGGIYFKSLKLKSKNKLACILLIQFSDYVLWSLSILFLILDKPMQLIESKTRGGYLFQAKHLKLLATSALLLTCEFNQAYAVDVKKAT
jgi:hypothetical protein